MIRAIAILPLLLSALLAARGEEASAGGDEQAAPAAAAEAGPPDLPPPGLAPSGRLGWQHRFESGLDGGGSLSVDRLTTGVAVEYRFSPFRAVGVGAEVGVDCYEFHGGDGLAALAPWHEVYTLALGLPVRWAYGQEVTLFAAPGLRLRAAPGADWEDATTVEGFAAVVFRPSRRLTIGPGLAVASALEDDPVVLPVLVFNWEVTEKWSIGTGAPGSGQGGPGLAVRYRATERLSCSAGGHFTRSRFRLGQDGLVPHGLGEDRAYGGAVGATYRFAPGALVTLMTGVEFGNELTWYDAEGAALFAVDRRPTAFVGVSAGVRF